VLINKTETTQEQNIFIVTNWEPGFLAIDSIFQMYPPLIS